MIIKHLKIQERYQQKLQKKLAEGEYEKFRVEQDKLYESDFNKEIKCYLKDHK